MSQALLLWGSLTSVYADGKHSYEKQAEKIMQRAVQDLKREDKISVNISRFKKAHDLLIQVEKQTKLKSSQIAEKQQTASIILFSVATLSLGVAVGLFIWNRPG